jgi:hypothetical protein
MAGGMASPTFCGSGGAACDAHQAGFAAPKLFKVTAMFDTMKW